MSIDEVTLLISELENMTRLVVEKLPEMDEEALEQFTNQREELVRRMEPYHSAMSESNKRQIGEILKHDPIILERMYSLKNEAGDWMERRKSIRVQQNAYLHASQPDSYFIDHKK